jgi:N-acetylglucosaminyldiphosphoundecaprenol N-acetyl-beta-D-mannosaminyltransferase
MDHKSVRVLGVPVEAVTESDVLAFAEQHVTRREPAQIATVNAEYVMIARKDPKFMKVLLEAELHTPDGMGVVWAARRRGLKVPDRVGGSDLISSISELAARRGYSVYLLGGGEGIASAAARTLMGTYPGLRIAGTYAGSRDFDPSSPEVQDILQTKPDILFVAFGAPYQDVWISQAKNLLEVPVIMGVGGSFNYLAGKARRAPRWIGERGFEWLFRLVNEPRRWKRMRVLPLFALLAILRRD